MKEAKISTPNREAAMHILDIIRRQDNLGMGETARQLLIDHGGEVDYPLQGVRDAAVSRLVLPSEPGEKVVISTMPFLRREVEDVDDFVESADVYVWEASDFDERDDLAPVLGQLFVGVDREGCERVMQWTQNWDTVVSLRNSDVAEDLLDKVYDRVSFRLTLENLI